MVFKPKDNDWSYYYEVAESDKDLQWNTIFRKHLGWRCIGGQKNRLLSGVKRTTAALVRLFGNDIQLFSMDVVLDFACGHGRIGEKFSALAHELILCDIRKEAIEFCRQRFHDRPKNCRYTFLVNTDDTIPLPDSSVSFLYSWDAMVHFERQDLEPYLSEFSRILRKQGCGFIHHSNYGSLNDGERKEWRENPHWRANVSASDVKDMCEEQGLVVVKQELLDWGVEQLDCITVFRKL